MVPRRSRLPAALFRSAGYRTVKTPYFTLKAKENYTTRNRIGVIVGANVHKSAVKRNFWKRQGKVTLEKVPNKGKDLLLILTNKVNSLTKDSFQQMISASAQDLI